MKISSIFLSQVHICIQTNKGKILCIFVLSVVQNEFLQKLPKYHQVYCLYLLHDIFSTPELFKMKILSFLIKKLIYSFFVCLFMKMVKIVD